MKLKQILAIVLLVFVVLSLVYMFAKEHKQADTDPSDQNTEQGSYLIVYYFHGDVRCLTCHKLETYAKEALEKFFPDKLVAKAIIWEPVNADEAQNKHFVQDYQLYTKSVVLSKIVDGKQIKWKNLDRIWEEVSNKQNYLEYIRQSIDDFLEDLKI